MLTEKLTSGSIANRPNHSFHRTPDGALNSNVRRSLGMCE